MGPAVDSDGTQAEIPDGVDNMIGVLQAICLASPTSPTIYPAVYSATGDHLTVVSSVRADSVVDTQRRRRDAMTGSSTTLPGTW